MPIQRRAILITGLVLLLIGFIILLLGAQRPNPMSDTIGAIFTLFGATTNYLQLFFRFPYDPTPTQGPAPTQAQAPTPTQAPIPAQALAPTSYGLMYFRLSGIVLIIGDIIFVVIGLLPFSLYTQPVLSSTDVIIGITMLVVSLGLPALQMKQPYQTRWVGLSGVAALCTGFLLFAIVYFLRNFNYYQYNIPVLATWYIRSEKRICKVRETKAKHRRAMSGIALRCPGVLR